jgi:hypothetical protein
MTPEPLKEIAVPPSKPAVSGPITLPLGFVARTITLGLGTRSLCCPDCGVPLNLLQPDEDDPSRLLGTCTACSKWVFLVEVEPDWKKALSLELPSGEAVRQGLEGSEGPRRRRRGP